MYILMVPDYVLAVRAPSGFDAQGNPVYEEIEENIVIDNTQRSVRLPPALRNYSIKKYDSNLPEDIQGLGDVNSGAGTGNKTGNSENLPDDMKYLEQSGNRQTNSTVGTTPFPSSGNTSVSTTASVNKTKTADNTFTLLWFIMTCLVVALVITVLYMVYVKKNNSSIENF